MAFRGHDYNIVWLDEDNSHNEIFLKKIFEFSINLLFNDTFINT